MKSGAQEGSVIVCIGAAGTIGASIASRLIRDGAHVIAMVRGKPVLRRGFTDVIQCDLASVESVERACDMLLARHCRIDGIVSAAGVKGHAICELTPSGWADTMQVKCLSPCRIVQRAAPAMERSKGASVVFLSSVAAFIAHRYTDYAASKAALVAAMRSFAWHLGPLGIRVNCVCPGPIKSRMTQMWTDRQVRQKAKRSALGRLGSPDDVASAVCFLLSRESQHITGASLDVSGGFEIR